MTLFMVESLFNILLLMIMIVPLASWSEKLINMKFIRLIEKIVSPLTKPFKWLQTEHLDFSYLALYWIVALIKNIVIYYL